jgi:hypothetical protein
LPRGTLSHVLEKYPDMRFGLFSNTADLVIRTFMGFGWGNGQHDNCGGVATNVPAEVYEDGLLALRDQHHEDRGDVLHRPEPRSATTSA